MDDPETYKHTPAEKFTINSDLEDIYHSWDHLVSAEELPVLVPIVKELAKIPPHQLETEADLQRSMNQIRKIYRASPKKAKLLHVYMLLQSKGELPDLPHLKKVLIMKASKSQSGVLVITVLTSPYPEVDGKPQKFSCEWDCHYCPNEPDQPRSYLHDEPSVLRANRNKFDPLLQFCDRAVTLAMNGHPVDKVELLILGGTWASYPKQYQENFIRDLFFAANTFSCSPRDPEEMKNAKTRTDLLRTRYSLEEEKRINETAACKIIGITLETRPDCINAQEILDFRRYGCTRVQLGLQHTNDDILKKINRQCTTADAKHAIRLLKNSCYKMDIHLMPNLPGSSPELDMEMFDQVLNDPDLQVDQWKIYPCEVTPWTVIKKWFDEGSYVPYGEQDLLDVLIYGKSRVHPWIRLNRVVRDIPSQYILGGVNNPSMRMNVHEELARRGLYCPCIRCREIKSEGALVKESDSELMIRKYRASGGDEYFISVEAKLEGRKAILGFVRLRLVDWKSIEPSEDAYGNDDDNAGGDNGNGEENEIQNGNGHRRDNERNGSRSVMRSKSPFARQKTSTAAKARARARARARQSGYVDEDDECVVPELYEELKDHALIRELHVYGQLIPTKDVKASDAQHTGLGTRLMHEAERIAKENGFTKVAVISGVGARGFYRKIGYHGPVGLGEMMIIDLDDRNPSSSSSNGENKIMKLLDIKAGTLKKLAQFLFIIVVAFVIAWRVNIIIQKLLD